MDIFTSFLRLPSSIFSVIWDPITLAAFQRGTVGRPLEAFEKWPHVLLLPNTVAYLGESTAAGGGQHSPGMDGAGSVSGKGGQHGGSVRFTTRLCTQESPSSRESLGKEGT